MMPMMLPAGSLNHAAAPPISREMPFWSVLIGLSVYCWKVTPWPQVVHGLLDVVHDDVEHGEARRLVVGLGVDHGLPTTAVLEQPLELLLDVEAQRVGVEGLRGCDVVGGEKLLITWLLPNIGLSFRRGWGRVSELVSRWPGLSTSAQ